MPRESETEKSPCESRSKGQAAQIKEPSQEDLALIKSIELQLHTSGHVPQFFLGVGANWGDTYRAGYHRGYEYLHDFYFPRTLLILEQIRQSIGSAPSHLRTHLMALVTSVCFAATHLYKFRTTGGGQPAGNNLYIPALIKEQNIFAAIRRKFDDLLAAEMEKRQWKIKNIVSTNSSADLRLIPSDAIDYVFVDPPFGANIMLLRKQLHMGGLAACSYESSW